MILVTERLLLLFDVTRRSHGRGGHYMPADRMRFLAHTWLRLGGLWQSYAVLGFQPKGLY